MLRMRWNDFNAEGQRSRGAEEDVKMPDGIRKWDAESLSLCVKNKKQMQSF